MRKIRRILIGRPFVILIRKCIQTNLKINNKIYGVHVLHCTVLYNTRVSHAKSKCVDRIIKLLYYSYSTNQE